MAATARRLIRFLPVLLLACGLPLFADRPADIRAQVTYVASALASGNPTDALEPFDQAMPGYEKLRSYFAGLTGSFDTVSEIEIQDEDDAGPQTTLKVTWALQVADRGTSSSVRRSYDVTMRLKQDESKGKWKIVSFTPIDMFNPQLATQTR